MAFLIGGANSAAADAAYTVANSCRWNDDDSPYMHKDLGTPTNAYKGTISVWLKRGNVSVAYKALFNCNSDGNNKIEAYFYSDDTLTFRNEASSSETVNLKTTRLFRDPSAWYHIVYAWDTTQGTDTNKLKLYVNGVQETVFATSTYPGDSEVIKTNVSGNSFQIGQTQGGTTYDGYLSEFVFIDGLQLTPTSFGEFDEDSPTIWKPKDVSGLTFGTNGFYLDFEASDNLGNDANGGTDLTEVNLAATDQTTDTPTNNFATTNPLNYGTNFTWSEGNLQISQASTNWDTTYSTIGVSSGKWYWEFKGTAGLYYDIGVTDVIAPTANISTNSGCVAYKSNSEFARAGSVGGGLPSNITDPASSEWTTNDIMSIALDVDNEAVYFAKNGTWEVSSDPESGASKTGAVTLPNSGSTYFFAFAVYGSPGTGIANFGNPPYANSSDAADADGYGAFEYAPPSGYFALNTKNLAEYG